MIRWVVSYEGIYKISDTGVVYSYHDRANGSALKTRLDRYGRVRVHLYKSAKRVNKQVHRLVAQAFLDNYSEDLTVNHLDGNPRNNNLNNLEMCTNAENMKHALLNGFINQKGEKHNQCKLNNKKVIAIKVLLQRGNITQREIAKIYDVHFSTISEISLTKAWTHLSVNDDKIAIEKLNNIEKRVIELRVPVKRIILKGEDNPNKLLNEEDIFHIRWLINNGLTHLAISKKFNVSRGLISHISRGEAWSHI